MTNLGNYFKGVFSAIGGVIGYFVGVIDGFMITLVAFVVVDYITGVIAAIIQKKISSEIGFHGILKKVEIFLLVGIGTILDHNILGGSNVLRTAIIFFYIANEGISIAENAAVLGLPVPKKLKDTLAQLKDKSEEDEGGKKQ